MPKKKETIPREQRAFIEPQAAIWAEAHLPSFARPERHVHVPCCGLRLLLKKKPDAATHQQLTKSASLPLEHALRRFCESWRRNTHFARNFSDHDEKRKRHTASTADKAFARHLPQLEGDIHQALVVSQLLYIAETSCPTGSCHRFSQAMSSSLPFELRSIHE